LVSFDIKMKESSNQLLPRFLVVTIIIFFSLTIPSLISSRNVLSDVGNVTICISPGECGILQSGYTASDSITNGSGKSIKDKTIEAIRELTTLGRPDLKEPIALCADPRGFVFVSDGLTGMIFRYTLNGKSIEFERPSGTSALYPVDIASVGFYVYVLDYSSRKILRYDFRGAYLDVLVALEEIGYLSPVSISIANDGRIIMTDTERHMVSLWSPLMDFQVEIGEFESGLMGLVEPVKAITLSDGTVAVLDSGDRMIKFFSPSGAFEGSVPLGGSIGVNEPRYMCIDRYDNIFVADAEGKVLVVRPDGEVLYTVDSFNDKQIVPTAVACGWNSELFVTDMKSHSVLVYKITYR